MDAQKVYDRYYCGAPAWEIGQPQPAFLQVFDCENLGARVLDVGCGTGELALELARRGVSVVGIDISPVAIGKAQAKAQGRNLKAEFIVADVFAFSGIGGPFDTVIDSGLFHVMDDTERYVRSLAALLVPCGRVHLLCYSDKEPPGLGPRRVSMHELRAAFSRGFSVNSIREARCKNHVPQGAHGWLAKITRSERDESDALRADG